MNILLINHYAGSPDMGMEFRPYYFAREWIKMGHKVDIIAADYSHLRRKNPVVTEDFQKEDIDGITYHWIKTNQYEGNGAKRAMTMAKFVSKLWLHSKRIVRELEPDVVICSSTYPLDTFVGQRIKKKSRKKVKLIHEVHDMWPVSPIEIGGMSPHHPFIMAMQMAENSFCRNSDKVVSLLPAAKDYLVEHGMCEDKFVHIANGVVLEDWIKYESLPDEISEHLKRNKEKGKFNLCFFGSIHKTYNLEILIKTVISMNRDDLFVTFVGSGLDKDELKNITACHDDKFKFFNAISKKAIPDLFNYIDATFIGIKESQIARFGICMNKLFDSMMGGKPILYMVDAPSNYIKEYNCGISVDGQETEDLQHGIEKLISLSEEQREELGKNGHNAAVKVFNYSSLARQFGSIMQ